MLSHVHVYELQKFTADSVYGLLKIAGYNPAIDNLAIAIPIENGQWGAMIDWDCVGWKSMLAFFALVFATDFSLRKKAWGMVFIPLIYVVNVLRIFFMFAYVKAYGLAEYAIVHQLVWSWGLIIVILALWLYWIRYVDVKPSIKKRH
jgi:exosortase/archaeosortase family protein